MQVLVRNDLFVYIYIHFFTFPRKTATSKMYDKHNEKQKDHSLYILDQRHGYLLRSLKKKSIIQSNLILFHALIPSATSDKMLCFKDILLGARKLGQGEMMKLVNLLGCHSL